MKKTLKFEPIVKDVLKRNPEARDSDNILYLEVIETIKPESSKQSIEEFLLSLNKNKLPTIESVGRMRRRIQEDNPELQGSEKTRKRRRQLEEEYYEHYRR